MKVFDVELEIPGEIVLDPVALINSIQIDGITLRNYVILAPNICEIVEKIKGIHGETKKRLALVLFKQYAKDKLNWTQEDIDSRVDLMSATIEITILVSKGIFNINKTIGCLAKFFCRK